MSGILFTTIAGSLTGTVLAALTQDTVPLGTALMAYIVGGLIGLSIGSTLPMLRKID